MPSIREKTTKAGKRFYEIRVSRGRGQSYLTTRWYVPEGWGQKAIDRELAKAAAEFERKCHAGEIISREEKRERAAEAAAEAAKIRNLRQYAETVFMPAKTVTISENGRASYQGNLDHWIYPALGDLKMPDITPANISALLLSMQSQGKAVSTVTKTYTILHSLFKMAYINDAISKNPMDKVEHPKARKDEIQGKGVEAFTVEEVQDILDAVEQEPLKWKVFLRLLIDTGVRRGEACALRWKDIDFEENTITIAGNLCYTKAKGVYWTTPKNGRTRTIDVDPEVTALLRQLRSEQAEKAISQWVFSQENSPEPMNPQTPTRYFQKFGKRYNIKDFHPHKLRHTSASLAITNGADVVSVSQRLGHSDPAVTLRKYAHANEESIRRAGQIVRDVLKKKAAE